MAIQYDDYYGEMWNDLKNGGTIEVMEMNDKHRKNNEMFAAHLDSQVDDLRYWRIVVADNI